MDLGLAGKKVIINGGAHGLGLASLTIFAAEGADVACFTLAAQKIRVNIVSPGAIYYPGGNWETIKSAVPPLYEGTLAQMPMGRFGEPEEVAKAIVFMASPACPYMTGAHLVIDGGFTKRVQF